MLTPAQNPIQNLGTASSSSLTPSVFQESMAKIRSTLDSINTQKQDEALNTLATAYSALTELNPQGTVERAEVNALRSSIIGQYGFRAYPNFENALFYSLTALMLLQNPDSNHYPTTLKLLDSDDLSKRISQYSEEVMQTQQGIYDELIEKQPNDQQKLELFNIFYTIGRCYHHTKPEFSGLKDPSIGKNFYLSAAATLTSLREPTHQSRTAQAELQYNILPWEFLDKIKKEKGSISEEDLLASFQMLDKTKEYDSSKVMEARIANLKAARVATNFINATDNPKPEHIRWAKDLLLESIGHWDEVLVNPDQYDDKTKSSYICSRAIAHNNYLKFLLMSPEIDIHDADKHVKFVKMYFDEKPGGDPYFMILMFNLAKLEYAKGNTNEVNAYIEKIKQEHVTHASWPDTAAHKARLEAFIKTLGSEQAPQPPTTNPSPA